ncbi:uncharacterized protein [Miscanthus floridulus]|uniref:uncharacterized protein isoform X2 n=1 Tax=Miscanthus floridulus TaxID=154761 RepID=UPI003459B9E7
MPGSIHISATQPPVITPLFLQVAVGKREYSGNIEQDDLSFPVTSLRESMVIMLYNAELKTKAIVESGTMDAVFTLDSGGKIILQVQFLLNDDDRKRIQEMRNSAMKRKQQELLGDGNELNFPDSPLSKRLIEKISNIQSKGAERSKLRKSLSLDDLQERAVLSGINVDPRFKKASGDSLLQRGVRDTLSLEDPSGSKKGNTIPESKSSSSVRKMISTFGGTTPQGIISETDVSPTTTDSGSTQAGKTVIPFDDHKASNYRSGKTVSSQHIKTSEPVQTGMPKTTESSRSRSSETGVSPTPTDSGSTPADKTVIPFDDHKASNYRSGKTVSSQHIKTSEPVQTGMPKTTESRRSRSSETGVSPTPTDSGSTQAGKTVTPFDDHKASNYRSGKTVSSQHIKTSAPVQTGMPKTTESKRSHSSETGVSPTPTDSGSAQAGKTVIPFDDDHKASNYRSGKTVSSQHIKTRAPVQTGMPKTTESRTGRRSGSRDGASKQNLRENELIRTKRRPQAKHQRSIGPSYSAEQMHSRDYVERPLNYLVATSSTWIHPHICVTSASKQLKDLLELELLNSLAHIQHTGKSQHVQEDIQENKSDESIAAAQTRSGGFPMINGWLINQGVRAAIVVIACGAMFFNNR